MLDPRFVREHPDLIEDHLRRRGLETKLGDYLKREERRLYLLQKSEEKKHERNVAAKKVAQAAHVQREAQREKGKKAETLKAEQKAGDEKLFASLKEASKEIKAIDEELESLRLEQQNFLLHVPNLLDEKTPLGRDESANVCLRQVGEPAEKNFPIKAHYELAGADLDFQRASKISGARFAVLQGDLAMLERALGHFFLNQNIGQGFKEISPPSLVSGESMQRSGQLPKFSADVFRLGADFEHLYLIPTSEIPLMNIHANEILDSRTFPIRYTALSPCFRSEAGAAGRDTRGLMRLHEFKKVEMVSLCLPEQSQNEHEYMTKQAERLLQALGIPYRVMVLCSGDVGFSARLCYDIEAWIPSEGKYREISSCSNCGDFQCRRAKIRYRDEAGKIAMPHSLNGSALPLGRTMIALLENFQEEDFRVRIPEVLRPFMGGKEYILQANR